MRNIGASFIALAQYQDAVQTYESVMEACPDYKSGKENKVRTYCCSSQFGGLLLCSW